MDTLSPSEDELGAHNHAHRVTKRKVNLAPQLPLFGTLHCAAWDTDLRVEFLNYHFRGACLRVVSPENFHEYLGKSDDIYVDIFLGQERLKHGMPVRIAWNDVPTSGMLGVEFLADSRAFVHRAERYCCHDMISPQLKTRDPLDVHRFLYCKVLDVSQTGLLLSTSLTNNHLLPGMTFEAAELTLPGEQPLTVNLVIQNTREATPEGFFHLGVRLTSHPQDYQKLLAGYLSAMSPTFWRHADDASSKQDHAIRGKRLKQGLTYRVVRTEDEYREVLRLRHQGYGAKGKLGQRATIASQGEGLSQEGMIIGAYLAGTLVAAMEVRFWDAQQPFRILDIIPRDKLKAVNLHETVEINRLVVHPQVQGTDIVIGMIQKIHAIVMVHGGKDILLVATNKLKPLYRKLGCIDLGVQAPHPVLENEQLNAMLFQRASFLDGSFLHPSTWTQIYRATTEFFQNMSGPSFETPELSLESSGSL